MKYNRIKWTPSREASLLLPGGKYKLKKKKVKRNRKQRMLEHRKEVNEKRKKYKL